MSLDPELEILVATFNPGKIREVQEGLRYLPVKLRFLNELPNVSSVDEVGQTYKENAVLKALGYAQQTGLVALADDSGLEVELLGGKPGVFSARFGGEQSSDSGRVEMLLEALSKYESQQRNARFVCCMALAGWETNFEVGKLEPQVLTVSEAQCKGVIASTSRGSNGFGLDPVFVPASYSQTFAELSAEIKGEISHRALALAGIRMFLSRTLTQT